MGARFLLYSCYQMHDLTQVKTTTATKTQQKARTHVAHCDNASQTNNNAEEVSVTVTQSQVFRLTTVSGRNPS